MSDLVLQYNGMQERTHYDEAENKFVVSYEGDPAKDLEHNKRHQTETDRKFGEEPGMMAWIPNIVAIQLLKDFGLDVIGNGWKQQIPLLKRVLNDPQYRFLRTQPGKM